MKRTELILLKILTLSEILQRVTQWRVLDKKIAFTNGVFDILHAGHLQSLSAAAKEADYLIVGLNADVSARKLKGPNRPINDQGSRALVLASLMMVDAVVIFEEDTPEGLIRQILPDVLVKGGDYTVGEVVGSAEVLANGGRVIINPTLEGYSTTSIIRRANESAG